MLSLDSGEVAVRFANGTEKTCAMRAFGMLDATRAREKIRQALSSMLPKWVNAAQSTTSVDFRLYKVTEIVVTLTLSNYCKNARRFNSPDARPFQVEYFVKKLSTRAILILTVWAMAT